MTQNLDARDVHDIDYMIDLEFEEFDKRVENKRKEFQSRGFVDDGERAWSAGTHQI